MWILPEIWHRLRGDISPVARYTFVRSILALVAIIKWKVHQMDVKTTFLNGVVEDKVHME